MNKKNCILITVALVLAGVYAVYFTGWFRAKTIQISYTSRPAPAARNARNDPNTRPNATADRVMFALQGYYSLTEVKVVPLVEFQTNKFALPVWDLVSDEGSDDVDRFFYGERIRGMDPAVAGARPEPLQPGVTYRLFVSAGKVKGQHDFTPK